MNIFLSQNLYKTPMPTENTLSLSHVYTVLTDARMYLPGFSRAARLEATTVV